MTTQIKAGVIAANAVNSSELASGALSGQNFTGDVTFDTTTLKIDSSNNRVGIGTASPSVDLETLGSGGIKTGNASGTGLFKADGGSTKIGSFSNHRFDLITNNTVKASIDTSGQVGIGTTSPAAGLHVDSPDDSQITGILDTDNAAVKLVFRNSAETGNNIQIGADGSNLVALTNATERMRIDSSGNVGIGNSSPTRNLTVGDTASSSAINIKSSATNGYSILAFGDSGDDNYAQIFLDNSTNKVQIQNGGGGAIGNRGITLDSSENVGIGTSSPSTKLHVNGAIRLTDSTYSIYSSSASAVIGHIGNTANDLNIYSSTTGHNGLRFHVNGILPTDNTGTIIDGDANLGESNYRFKDIYLSGIVDLENAFRIRSESGQTGTLGFNRNPADGTHLGQSGLQRFQINGPFSGSDFLDFQNYNSSGTYTGGFRIVEGSIQGYPQVVSKPTYSFIGDSNTGMTRPTGDTLQFVTGGSEAMRINSNGRLLIDGTADRGSNLCIGGDSNTARVLPMTDNVGYIGDSTFRWQAIYANNSSIQTSDEREKTQIKETTLGLDFIKDLKPISYKWIDAEQCNKGKDEREHQGLIAQQVAETVEKHGIDKNTFGGLDIQKTEKYDDFHGMSYDQFVSPLIKAIQEQQTIIDDLKSRIETLEG